MPRNTKIRLASLLSVFICLFGTLLPAIAGTFDAAPGQSTLKLAGGGTALLPIVISPQASKETQSNAAELADYLKRITGASFEIKTGDGNTGIVLGTLKEFPNPSLVKPLEIRDHYNGLEAFCIRTEAKRMLLIGATDMGVSHAMFRFLELLGHRRFFPHAAWDISPKIPALSVSFQEDSRPAILNRRIWYGFGVQPVELAKAGFQWARQNRLAANLGGESSLRVSIGHAWTSVATANREAFKAHPEYLALVKDKDGKMVRQGPQLCVGNPAVQKMVADYAVKGLETKPDSIMVSVGPADGAGFCQCDLCKKLGNGSVSDQVFFVTNEAARAVEARFPGQGKMVSTYAYSFHTDPPSFALEPNVFVELTAGYNYSEKGYSFEQLADLWGKKTKNLGFREYFSVWQWDFDLPARARASNIAYLRKQIPYYISQGGDSISAESGFNWGPNGLGYYIASHLMWDGNADVDVMLDDFYTKAFGPAAPPMKRFYERYDRGRSPLISEQWHGFALRDLQEASALAKDRPDVQDRIDQLKQYMHYIKLRWVSDSTGGDLEARKAAFLSMMDFGYRERGNGMNHWNAMRRAGAGKASVQLKEPKWSWKNDPGPKPWENQTPWTKADTDRAFAEDLQYFKAIDLQDKTFSNDLVPVHFEAQNVKALPLSFQVGNFAQAFYAEANDPIKIRLTPGIVWEQKLKRASAVAAQAAKEAKVKAPVANDEEGAEAGEGGDDDDEDDAVPNVSLNMRYRLTARDGKVAAEGLLPIDFKPHDLEFKVLAAGVYFLNLTGEKTPRARGGWSIEVLSKTPNVMVLPRDLSIRYNGRVRGNKLFFYVPKGTKTVQYYWSAEGHVIYPPGKDGKNGITVQPFQRFISRIQEIPVPTGMDGKLWSISYNLRMPWFFNIPNILSTSPETMLVPRELAKQDGLTLK